MGFNLDFDEVYEGGIKDGLYEVVVNRCSEDATPGGAEYTEFDLIVRNDLDQPHINQHIFEKNFKSKKTGKYNMKMFNTIGKACQLQNGKTYNSFEELLKDFEGKTVQVLVKNEESEYNGKTYNNLNVKQWKQTGFPDLQHQFNGDDKDGAPFTETPNINDNQLPF